MSKLEQIVKAYRAIDTADRHYRKLLRDALAKGEVQQADVARQLGLTREKIRRDAMSEEQRAQLRAADAERKRQQRPVKAEPTDTPTN